MIDHLIQMMTLLPLLCPNFSVGEKNAQCQTVSVLSLFPKHQIKTPRLFFNSSNLRFNANVHTFANCQKIQANPCFVLSKSLKRNRPCQIVFTYVKPQLHNTRDVVLTSEQTVCSVQIGIFRLEAPKIPIFQCKTK